MCLGNEGLNCQIPVEIESGIEAQRAIVAAQWASRVPSEDCADVRSLQDGAFESRDSEILSGLRYFVIGLHVHQSDLERTLLSGNLEATDNRNFFAVG